MASDEPPTPPDAPATCSPCRGTGQVISNLGGTPSTLTCPWCEGTGHVIPDHDALAARRAQQPQ